MWSKVDCFEIEPEDVVKYRTHEYERPPFQYSADASVTEYAVNPVYTPTTYASAQHFPGLKCVLEAAFADYDFSMACPWHFKLIQNAEEVRQRVHWALMMHLPDSRDLLTQLWSCIDSEISIGICDIYEYSADCPDAFSEMGTVFNLMYFFLNEKTNRVLVFHLTEGGMSMNTTDDEDLEDQYGFTVF
jgi:hypothetical protein